MAYAQRNVPISSAASKAPAGRPSLAYFLSSHASALGLELEAEKTAGRRKRLSTVIVSRTPEDEDPSRDQEEHHDR